MFLGIIIFILLSYCPSQTSAFLKPSHHLTNFPKSVNRKSHVNRNILLNSIKEDEGIFIEHKLLNNDVRTYASRRNVLATIGVLPFLMDPSSSNAQEMNIQAQSITMPLESTGNSYLIYYRVSQSLFRAVLDTGSPFLMLPNSCSENTRAKAGCYREQGVPSGLSNTIELFDGFEGEVEWRKGGFSFYNATGSMMVSSPTFIFGVANDDILSGTGGLFFGLIKNTDKRIRPSFLGQTEVTSFIVDLRNDKVRNISPSLTLSTVPYLANRDYIPITNYLRKCGDPVQHYVSKLKSIFINGQQLIPKDKRPIYAIIDTGTTGMVVSKELYDQRYIEARERRERKLWGGEVELTFETEMKNTKSIKAVKPLTTPFDRKPNWKKFKGHVIVVGLSFLEDQQITIDIDDRRLWFEQ